MRSECLPFSQVPHTTKLFADYLTAHSKVQQFYPRTPYFRQWFSDQASVINYDADRRQRVSDILLRQNQSWGASDRTLQNIARLRAGSVAAVTGQQVGLFGGPAFSIFKALTAVKLATIATQGGVDCVPVFWLATEDHDLAEVSHTSVPTPDGTLQALIAATQGPPNAPVGTVKFGSEIDAVIDAAAAILGDSPAIADLRESYRAGENFGSAFAKLFARWFADWGVILLDSSDPALHQVSAPVLASSIERAAELNEKLLARGRELETAGYHQQVKVTSSSTALFAIENGARIPIHRHEKDFIIGSEKINTKDLLGRIAAAPQEFSPNVLLRPVVQDYLLPTLTYIGGSAEVAYFAQAAVVYQSLLGKVTPVLPRFSATLVESKPQSLLERYKLTLRDLFKGPDEVRRQLAAQALPGELQAAFDAAIASLEKTLTPVRASLARLDKTLVEAADNAKSKMQHQLESLRDRAARAELRQSEVLDRHAALLSNNLYPNKILQERELPGAYFVSRHGKELLSTLYDAINPDCLDHQVISL